MSKKAIRRSLKDQNRWQLWLAIAANALIFYAVIQVESFTLAGLKPLFSGASNLLPAGFALILTTVANGFFSADAKARLVFLRWTHALPGHRAFSVHAISDPRIDVAKLRRLCGNKLPTDPAEQNRTWYRLYKTVEHVPAVEQVHRDFLLMRDYTGLSALFLIVLGTAALFMAPSWRVSAVYCGCLAVQLILVRHAAATYGIRFTKTVLAEKSAGAR
jgi:hypothetical protein